MRLSDAILIGDTLKKHHPDTWLSKDGSCGCAFGGALLAAGIGNEFLDEQSRQWGSSPNNFDCVRQAWPWLNFEHLTQITRLHRALVKGKATIEQIADYARSIEPAEEAEKLPEPTADDGYYDDEPLWSDGQTEIARQNSIKGR